MATTYEPIATYVASSNQTTFTFSSIPQTYTDLRLVFNWYGNSGAANTYPSFQFNGNSSGYYYRRWYQTGQQGVENDTSFLPNLAVVTTPSQPCSQFLDIFGYTGSTYKSGLMTFNQVANGTGWKVHNVLCWNNTAAITSLTAGDGNGFGPGTRATLYGIKAA